MRYSFKEFHFTSEQLKVTAPEKKENALTRINNSLNTLCLALTFHISLGLSARKTAFALRNVFSLKVSYQTILNYCELAAYYCHQFNLAYKGDAEAIQAGDESCIKVFGEKNYGFFFIAPKGRMITAYQIASNKDTLPATVAMREALRTVPEEKKAVVFITDGNPSYQSAIHFLNQNQTLTINHKPVIGLQNLDSASEEFRPFRQLIERLFRTYKFHIKAAYGFK
ncbi:MAG: DDE-type integrase/transposase/recombinase, partial [candidate division WOR-3 bacterium]